VLLNAYCLTILSTKICEYWIRNAEVSWRCNSSLVFWNAVQIIPLQYNSDIRSDLDELVEICVSFVRPVDGVRKLIFVLGSGPALQHTAWIHRHHRLKDGVELRQCNRITVSKESSHFQATRLIELCLPLSQTPASTARQRIQGECITLRVCLCPGFCWYSLCLPEGWPGWDDLDGWLHSKTIYSPASSHPSKY